MSKSSVLMLMRHSIRSSNVIRYKQDRTKSASTTIRWLWLFNTFTSDLKIRQANKSNENVHSNIHLFSNRCTRRCLCKLNFGKGRVTLTSSLDCSWMMRHQFQGLVDLPMVSYTSSFLKVILQMALCCPSRDGGAVVPESIWAFRFFSQCLSETPTFLANYNRDN